VKLICQIIKRHKYKTNYIEIYILHHMANPFSLLYGVRYYRKYFIISKI